MTTKETITHSALETFYIEGFHAAGVDKLSQNAGVTKRTLYHHFEDKAALIKSALELRDRQFMDQVRGYLSNVSKKLRPLGYINYIAIWVQKTSFNGCFFINAAAEYGNTREDPHKLAKKHKDELRLYLKQLCKEAGIIKYSLVAQQLFLLGEGLIVATQVCGPQKEIIDATKKAACLLID